MKKTLKVAVGLVAVLAFWALPDSQAAKGKPIRWKALVTGANVWGTGEFVGGVDHVNINNGLGTNSYSCGPTGNSYSYIELQVFTPSLQFINLLSYDEVYGILKTLGLKDTQKYSSEDLARIARQSRASHTITGTILKPGDKIIVTLAMKGTSGKDGRPWSKEFECSGEAEIPAAVDRMTTEVKQALGLTRSQISGDLDVNPFCYYHLGAAYDGSGDHEKARKAAERGLSLYPDNGLIKGILFRSDVALRKINDARVLLDKWAATSPGLWVDFRRGDLEAIQGKYDEAAALFSKYDPLNDFIKVRLPFLRLWEGKIGQAIDLARKAEDHLSLIYLNYLAGNFDAALAEAQKALQNTLGKRSFSGQAEAFQMRGLVELALGDIPAAERTAEALKRCADEAPNRRLAGLHHFLIGMIEGEAGRYARAADELAKAIALRPAEHWIEEGYPCRPNPYDSLAAVYFKFGDLGRAKEEYRKIQSFPLVRLQLERSRPELRRIRFPPPPSCLAWRPA